MHDGMALACGQCLPCRISRRRVWTHRILLEATQHNSNAFITLTYDDKNLPEDKSVDVREWQLFIKRVRHTWAVRYYACGEYGETTMRPHYHAILFGHPICERGQTDLRKISCCTICDQVKKHWGKGAIQVGRLEPESAAYVAGYVTKKIKRGALPEGVKPEFQRMSLRPGLGYGVLADVSHVLMQHELEKTLTDVPVSLRHGTTQLPLGRYLRQNLRKQIGRDEKCPEEVKEQLKENMRVLRETAFVNSQNIQEAIREKINGKLIQIHSRENRARKGQI